MTQWRPTFASTMARSPIQESTADGYAWPCTRLLADRNIQPIDSVLASTVGDRDMRSQQNVVLESNISQAAVETDVNVPTYFSRRM